MVNEYLIIAYPREKFLPLITLLLDVVGIILKFPVDVCNFLQVFRNFWLYKIIKTIYYSIECLNNFSFEKFKSFKKQTW